MANRLNDFLHNLSRWRLVNFKLNDCQASLRLSPGAWLPIVVWIVVVTWYILGPSEVSATCATALAGILAASYLWARTLAVHIHARRALHFTALQIGDELEEYITLSNRANVPALWVEFIDRSHIPGYNVSSVRAADANTSAEWRAHTTCTRRGVFTLGPWELRTGDPLGLFSVRQVYHQQEEILVYPSLAPLPASLLPQRNNVGDNRPLHQPLAAESINVVTTRQHQPGDPLHHIHWRTTARRDTPYVKSFEPEASSTVWLIPDLDVAAHTGEGADNTTETMTTLLASLAAQLLQERLAVGLFAYDGETHLVMPQRGQMHLLTLLRALAVIQPAPAGPFSATLARAQSLVATQDLVVAVTPALPQDNGLGDGGWPRAIRQMARGRTTTNIEVILLDAASFTRPSEEQAAAAPDSSLTSADSYVPILAEMGIRARVVHRGDIHPISGAYGELRRWDFITLGTGRVIARHAPRQVSENPQP